jgi:hypothetical protein
MAYDRYDRDEHLRWSDDRSDRGRGRDERGFWDRASDQVASWFGDDDAERRRREDNRGDERMGRSERGWTGSNGDRGSGRNYDRDRSSYGSDQSSYGGGRSDRDFNYDRGVFNRGGSSERDYNPGSRRELWGSRDRNESRGSDRDFERNRDMQGGYRPMTGDYGRGDNESEQFFAASGYGRGQRGFGDRDRDRDFERSQSPYGRDDYRRTSFAGSRKDDRDYDPPYQSWRDRHMSDLDRDYDDYRREHQSRFENDFTSWREKRQHKRGLLGRIREHMEVVGSDDNHVGTVDKTAGDRIILTKSDPDSGGAHHSLSCSDIDRIEGDKVILDCSADEAQNRWRDESRSRALFEREDQGEMGPRGLNRSFEGTYR